MTDRSECEYVAWVDDQDRVLDALPRTEIRRRNLLHRSVYVLVWNAQNELFVHQRAWGKDLFPGYWDICVSGVPRFDETYKAAALRELREELGLCELSELRFLCPLRYADRYTRVIGRVYSCRALGPIRLQREEIVQGEFVARRRLPDWVSEHRVCPDSLAALREVGLLPG